MILLVAFIERNRYRQGKVESLILFIDCRQSRFSGCPFPRGRVNEVLCYDVKKVAIILVGLA